MNSEHAALFKLGVAERIRLVEDLWDSIALDESTGRLPSAALEELRRRKLAFERAPESGRTWSQVKQRARGTHA